MSFTKLRNVGYTMAGALLLVAMLAASAEAKLFKGLKLQEEMPTPAATGSSDVLTASPVSLSAMSELNAGCGCCPTPCVKYRHVGLHKVKCCGCEPPVSTALCVKNPCTCCPVVVPVCLPACCCGEPKVSCRPTLLAQGEVTYDWCCGVRVTVRFQKCGDVLVTYRGV